jgi:anti-sigma factor RsiW
MLRLTLRTLLSYLDDTLEPSEATALGAKLAESEQAQEIVERMRNVIRRRRLTVPPAASRMDPNTIAEYLDNEISPEQAEELERVCLASNVHLAEVAACHQTLSILLGDPTEVPAGAIQRMVDLAKGTPTVARKSRSAPAHVATNHAKTHAPKPVAGAVDDDALPTLGGKSRLGRATVVLAGAAACVLLGVAIHQLVTMPQRPTGSRSQQHAKADLSKEVAPPIPTDPKATETKPPETKIAETKPIEAKLPDVKPPEAKVETFKAEPIKIEPAPVAKIEPETKTVPIVEADLPPPTFSTTPEPKAAAKLANVPLGPPSVAVAALGTMIEPAKDKPAVVLQRLDATGVWKRLSAQGGKAIEIKSTRPLVALPASRAAFDLGKVRLTLWGHVP